MSKADHFAADAEKETLVIPLAHLLGCFCEALGEHARIDIKKRAIAFAIGVVAPKLEGLGYHVFDWAINLHELGPEHLGGIVEIFQSHPIETLHAFIEGEGRGDTLVLDDRYTRLAKAVRNQHPTVIAKIEPLVPLFSAALIAYQLGATKPDQLVDMPSAMRVALHSIPKQEQSS